MKIFVFVLNFKGVDNCSHITLKSLYYLSLCILGNNNSNLQPLISNKFANAKIKHQTTEPNERQNGIFNKEDQPMGPSMEAKDNSEDDDMYRKSQQNQQCLNNISKVI